MSNNETYLGDAVYASFDGYQIWLRTGDGNAQRIALDPEVIQAFYAYLENLKRLYRRQPEEHGEGAKL